MLSRRYLLSGVATTAVLAAAPARSLSPGQRATVLPARLVTAANVATLSLDPPVTAALISKTIDAFAPHRLVEGYTGAVGTFKRLSDSATISTIGFDAVGRFDSAALDTWRAGADVDLVSWTSQTGSGRALAASGTVAVVRSNAYQRFGTDFNDTTGQLTRSATNGGMGVDLGGVGHLSVSSALSADLTAATGANLEVHLLMSPQVRKISTSDTTDPVSGATNTGETVLSYGNSQNARTYWVLAGGTGATTGRIQTSASDITNFTASPGSSGVGRWKAKAQNVLTFGLTTGGSAQMYGWGRRIQNQAGTTNNITAIGTTGTLNNGTLHIGANFASTANNTAATTLRGNYVFGGVVVTKGLTDLERMLVQAKLNAIGQQHRIKAPADILATYDEWFFAKDVDASGNVAGRNGLATLNFNKGGTSTDWDFAYTIPNAGIVGIRSPTANANNKFMANNTFFAGVTTGSMLALHVSEETGNALQYSIGRESSSYAGGLTSRLNLAMGFDHNAAGVITRWGLAKDTSEILFTGRWKAFNSASSGFKPWGAAIYEAAGGGINQSMGKYNVNTTHNFFSLGETITDPDVGSVTLTAATWLNQTSYLLDAPVAPPTSENMGAILRQDALLLHMANFEAPAGYDPTASYATRKAQRLTAKVISYLATPTLPIGHFDGSYAANANAGVADGNSDDRLQSFSFTQGFKGSRVAFAFKVGTLTRTQIEEVQVNLYKLVS